MSDEMGDERNNALLLLQLGSEAGGRIDPQRIARRGPQAASRRGFEECRREGWIDGDGWLTAIGREALKDWR